MDPVLAIDADDFDFWNILDKGLVEPDEEGPGVEGREGMGVVVSVSSKSFFSAFKIS